MDKLVHWEIPSTDIERSKKFYTELFAWKFQPWASDYALFEVEDGVGGALMKVDKMPEPAIRVYIGVDDIPATLKKAAELGGRTGRPRTEIGGGMGYAGSFFDPCGCSIGLWSKS